MSGIDFLDKVCYNSNSGVSNNAETPIQLTGGAVMFFSIEFILSVVALGAICLEDRRRRKYGYGPIWTNLVFKLFVGGLTGLLTVVFIIEDGAWLLNSLMVHSADELCAIACAVIITLGGAAMFGTIAYLLVIPDDDPDIQVIADAIYYGSDDYDN